MRSWGMFLNWDGSPGHRDVCGSVRPRLSAQPARSDAVVVHRGKGEMLRARRALNLDKRVTAITHMFTSFTYKDGRQRPTEYHVRKGDRRVRVDRGGRLPVCPVDGGRHIVVSQGAGGRTSSSSILIPSNTVHTWHQSDQATPLTPYQPLRPPDERYRTHLGVSVVLPICLAYKASSSNLRNASEMGMPRSHSLFTPGGPRALVSAGLRDGYRCDSCSKSGGGLNVINDWSSGVAVSWKSQVSPAHGPKE
ncbi:hypothetical protein AG1IA_01664 [Rhizoctonia solani AG-1 IA]|uniref:Uncharacterized protein n=1 Tax=Thanatephorus cucumeris (strain AG1-IA) TaxID=983506 RepID=L8X1Z7_THACA|nr:hypothetical protein AG1IA_01664 [Rhizoctonia solani AG-1 IA]